jgi:hypothetical protein
MLAVQEIASSGGKVRADAIVFEATTEAKCYEWLQKLHKELHPATKVASSGSDAKSESDQHLSPTEVALMPTLCMPWGPIRHILANGDVEVRRALRCEMELRQELSALLKDGTSEGEYTH